MSSRKSRLSLSSDVRKEGKSAVKTPKACRTPARTTPGTKHSDTRSNDDSCEVSPSQGADYSPVISLTQDNAFHAINGVSWKWNSPQRFHGRAKMKPVDVKKTTHKPLLKQKHSEAPAEAPKQATGFNKFISKLNLLMGKENVEQNANPPETSDLPVDTLDESDFFTAEIPCNTVEEDTPDSDDDLFQQHCIDLYEDEYEILIDSQPMQMECVAAVDDQPMGQAMDDELDDSKLDRMLIEASQTVERTLSKPSLPPPTAVPKKTESKQSVPVEMNDSDMDGFLLQASLMVEEKLTDSSQDSNSLKPGPKVVRCGAATYPLSHTNNERPGRANTGTEGERDRPILDPPNEGVAASTRGEITMSQEDLKTLLEKKRQEALQRLQNNRLRRAMKGTNSNG